MCLQSLAPEYAEAATALKAHDATIMLGKVDATVHGDLAQKFGVQGYPTIKWFVDGTPMEYEVPRDACALPLPTCTLSSPTQTSFLYLSVPSARAWW